MFVPNAKFGTRLEKCLVLPPELFDLGLVFLSSLFALRCNIREDALDGPDREVVLLFGLLEFESEMFAPPVALFVLGRVVFFSLLLSFRLRRFLCLFQSSLQLIPLLSSIDQLPIRLFELLPRSHRLFLGPRGVPRLTLPLRLHVRVLLAYQFLQGIRLLLERRCELAVLLLELLRPLGDSLFRLFLGAADLRPALGSIGVGSLKDLLELRPEGVDLILLFGYSLLDNPNFLVVRLRLLVHLGLYKFLEFLPLGPHAAGYLLGGGLGLLHFLGQFRKPHIVPELSHFLLGFCGSIPPVPGLPLCLVLFGRPVTQHRPQSVQFLLALDRIPPFVRVDGAPLDVVTQFALHPCHLGPKLDVRLMDGRHGRGGPLHRLGQEVELVLGQLGVLPPCGRAREPIRPGQCRIEGRIETAEGGRQGRAGEGGGGRRRRRSSSTGDAASGSGAGGRSAECGGGTPR
mmetsp:Transcript_38440/g.115230  ORF Transcript_38440/g.115230 Transcript_38440/m.115230 type:complete len:458 (+) Transcript_38440:2354-3727(+)